MKKLLALMLIALLALPALACASPESDEALMATADEMVAGLTALCRSEGFVEMYAPVGEIAELFDEVLAGDYTQARQTAVITLTPDVTDNLLRLMSQGKFKTDDDQVTELLRMMTPTALPNMLNANLGATWLAFSGIAHCVDVRQLEGVEPGTAWVLTDHGDGLPLTCVTFAVKDDGLSMVSANFLKPSDDMKESLFAANDETSFDLSELLPAVLLKAIGIDAGMTHTVYER